MPLDSPRPDQSSRVRLHRYLAQCGLGARRACERLIDAGRVSVDHHIARKQGICVDPLSQVVMVDGKRVVPERKITILLNKPRDVLCTSADPQGRRTFKSLLPDLPVRLYTVGRLDRDSEGLLVVTNDGDLAHALAHPRHQVEKVYHVWLVQQLTPSQERQTKKGVRCGSDMLRFDDLKRLDARSRTCLYRIRLHEGRNRHIRRLFKAIGVDVVRLKRMAVGALELGRLRSGAWRYIREDEIKMLHSTRNASRPLGESGGAPRRRQSRQVAACGEAATRRNQSTDYIDKNSEFRTPSSELPRGGIK
ncbi:pseudouridine synthase [Verrucomicrobiota bacterium]